MTTTFSDLRRDLERIDGRSYRGYKDLQGREFESDRAPSFRLVVDHVQGDPFAAPSRMRVRLSREAAGFPDWATSSPSRRIGLETYLAKAFSRECGRTAGRAGSGKSGMFGIDTPGQEVIERTAVRYLDGEVEARFVVGLPARGRTALGRTAARMLCEDLPGMVAAALCFESLDEAAIRRAVEVNEDADALRDQLRERELVAFVADETVLPRRSGVDPHPMTGDAVVNFRSPESLRVTLTAPNGGDVTGMGIPEGVTLIVGGGFHGKSTLLNALEHGVYNHCADDGRERVVSRDDTVKIRAEDGRSVTAVDISPFINNLPGGAETTRFSTPNASGSTSQAASTLEAVESGAGVLLIDEDVAATNFMIRDRRMQALVAPEKEPITPFIARVRALYEESGISTVLVIGGSGDYFDVADNVIAMDTYVPVDVTARAKAIAGEDERASSSAEEEKSFAASHERRPLAEGIDPRKGRREVNVKTRGTRLIQFGVEEIDLSCVSQIVDESQARAIGAAIAWAVQSGVVDGHRTVTEVLDAVEAVVASGGLDAIARGQPGNFARFRRHELAAALNRLRTLRIAAE